MKPAASWRADPEGWGRDPGVEARSSESRRLLAAAAFLVVPAAVLLSLAWAEHQTWAPRSRVGVHAPAEVVGVSRWTLPNRIWVAFAIPDGRLAEASIPVAHLSQHGRGSTVEVAYDPANPRRARTVEDWIPPYLVPAGAGLLLGLVAGGVAWGAWRLTRRLGRVADVPPPPLDFYEAPGRTETASPRVARTLVPMLLALSLLVVPELVEAHRQVCPAPPRADGGDPQVLSTEELASAVPASFPGYAPGAERVRSLGSFANPPTVVALVKAGYLSGYERDFVAGTTRLKVEVFQFDTGAGPLRYETQRLATLCSLSHHRLGVPAGAGASATVVHGPDGPLHRMTFVRGSRDYVINLEGPAVKGDAGVLARLLETAQ